ncbi:DUF2878 family protein [Candidatus Woesearchaeota archaeon]|nr:DUF2878 family protein [Candidatus Woesearchaeota archaeon]MBN2881726.1 DUF2878 family protein [Candidatus Woesearchaeota archaeon]
MKRILTGISAILSLLVAALLWPWQWLALIAMIGVSIILLYKSTRSERKLFAICSIAGAGSEVFAIILGSWTYTNPTFIIPLWLIPLWGIASVFMSRTRIEIEEFEKNKNKKSKSKK